MQAMDANGDAIGRPESFGPVMTDARPESVPVLQGTEWMTTIEPDRAALDEAAFIQSLYEGVPHQTGVQREQEYQQQKRTAQQLDAQRRRP